MYTLITFATQWGSKYGGINSFNADFLTAFGIAYYQEAQIICIVASDTPEAREEAAKAHVQLIPLPYTPEATSFDPSHGQAGVDQLKQLNISFTRDKTVWLGHDRITGASAVAAACATGGRSAVIHHMSYDHYESYAETSESAQKKTDIQTALFQQADIVLAVGPLLRDAASDLIGKTKPVHMLIPGLAEIESQDAPHTFAAFLSGRLSQDAARIKQVQLGIAAFAKAQRDAREEGRPDILRRQPKLTLRGVDFEGRLVHLSSNNQQDPETELKQFAASYADGVVNLHALPYTEDRQTLYTQLSRSSVALMPSWHEGFGLVAWEAIAAGVPLIISENSGVYRLLEEEYPGAGTGSVYPLDIRGQVTSPYFSPGDLDATVAALKEVADSPGKARKQASILKNMLSHHTWAACAEQFANVLGWELKKGSLPDITPENLAQTSSNISVVSAPTESEREPLQIPTSQWRTGAGMADSQLLRAEEGLLPFDPARQPEVNSLNAWLDDPQWPIAVRLITGAGGQGKTRLALELSQQRRDSGWVAGFLNSALELNSMSANWQGLRKHDQPLLIVIDYAETRQAAFLALLKAALQNPGAKSVRFLLLARDSGEWWDNLPSRDTSCEGLLSGHATTGPYRLPSLYAAVPDRKAAYRKALDAFANALGVPAPDIVPELLGEHFERPLYIQMAALLALYGERPTTAQGLTRALLNHERRYWSGLLAPYNWQEPERRAEQLLVLTTLAGGFVTPRDAEPYWKTAKGDVLTSAEFHSLFRSLATLYPGTQGLQPLRPDLLGEALIAQAVLRHGGEALLDAVLTSSGNQSNRRRNALTVLARLSNYRPDFAETLVDALSRQFRHCYSDIVAVSVETTSPLPELAEQAFSRLASADKSQVAGMLAHQLVEESVQLAGLGCMVSEYLAKKAQERFAQKPGNVERIAEYARVSVSYAVKLSRMGHYQAAVDNCLVGLKLYSQLVGKDPRRFEGDYAMSLSNYASHLSDTGKDEDALEPARQALEIRQRLSQKNLERFEPDYAMSLSNYASHLRDAGKYEDALEPARQALEIHQRLSQKNLERFEPNYAMSLSNYANHLSDVGKDEDALEYARQALEIRQRLSQKNPDRFEPSYAMLLSNYASHLSDAGKYEDALEPARQALEIRQRLSQKNPDRFEPDYAMSLSNYANHLRDAGKDEDALEPTRQALEIHQRLSQKNLERFEPDHATSLSNYANHLSDTGKDEDALEPARQALEIRQRLSQKNPDRFEPDHATSLSNYASHLRDAGKDEDALEPARQALEIRQRLSQKNLERFEPNYATSLSVYANCLSAAGKYEDALEYARQALEIHRRLSQKNLERFEPDYAMSLSNYANHLSDAGKDEDALEYARQALEIRQRLSQKNLERFAESLFRTTCFVHFLVWLCEQDKNEKQLDFESVIKFIPQHQRPLMLLYSAFVEGCWSAEQDSRMDAFQQVLSTWDNLSTASKTRGQPYWLCAAAWCAEFSRIDSSGTDWEESFRQYANQRNGRLPDWMLKIAERLKLHWPE